MNSTSITRRQLYSVFLALVGLGVSLPAFAQEECLELVHSYRNETLTSPDGSSATLYGAGHDVAFSLDGTKIAVPAITVSGDDCVAIIDFNANTLHRVLLDPAGTYGDYRATALAFTPDDTRVAVGDYEGVVRVFDSETGQLLRKAQPSTGIGGTVTSIAVSPNGRWVLAGYGQFAAARWDKAGQKSVYPAEAITVGGAILYDLGTLEVKHTFPHTPSWGIQAVAFSPPDVDGAWQEPRILIAGDEQTAILHTVSVDPNNPSIISVDQGVPAISLSVTPDRIAATTFMDAAFSPEGSHIVACGYGSYNNWSYVGFATAWDAVTGNEVHTFVFDTNTVFNEAHWESALAVAFSPDGTAAVGGGRISYGYIKLLDLQKKEELCTRPTYPSYDYVYSLSASPDGQHLLAGMWYNDATYGDTFLGHTDLFRFPTPSGALSAEIESPEDGFVVGLTDEEMFIAVSVGPDELTASGEVSVQGTVSWLDGGVNPEPLEFELQDDGLYEAVWEPTAVGDVEIQVSVQDQSGRGLAPGSDQVTGEVLFGLFTLQATKDGYRASEPLQVPLDVGNEKITGTVIDEFLGMALRAATVEVLGQGGSMTTDDLGRFTFDVGEGTGETISVEISLRPDYVVELKADETHLLAQQSDGSSAEQTKTKLTVSVKTPDGTPIANRWVEFAWTPEEFGSVAPNVGFTNSEGTYEATFTTCPVATLGGLDGASVHVGATIDGETSETAALWVYSPFKTRFKASKPGFEMAEPTEVDIPSHDCLVTGRVVNADDPDTPISFASVEHLGGRETQADIDGNFSLRIGAGGEESALSDPLTLALNEEPVDEKDDQIRTLTERGYDESKAIEYLNRYVTESLCQAVSEDAEKDFEALRRLALAELLITQFDDFEKRAGAYTVTASRNLLNYLYGKLELFNKAFDIYAMRNKSPLLEQRIWKHKKKLFKKVRDNFAQFMRSGWTKKWLKRIPLQASGTQLGLQIGPAKLIDAIIGYINAYIADAAVHKERFTGGTVTYPTEVAVFYADLLSGRTPRTAASQPDKVEDELLDEVIMGLYFRPEAQRLIDLSVTRSDGHEFYSTYDLAAAAAREIYRESGEDFLTHIGRQGAWFQAREFSSAAADYIPLVEAVAVNPTGQATTRILKTITEGTTLISDAAMLFSGVYHVALFKHDMERAVQAVYGYEVGGLGKSTGKIAASDRAVHAARPNAQAESLTAAVQNFNAFLSTVLSRLDAQGTDVVEVLLDEMDPLVAAVEAENTSFQTLLMTAAEELLQANPGLSESYDRYHRLSLQVGEDLIVLYAYFATYFETEMPAGDHQEIRNEFAQHIADVMERHSQLAAEAAAVLSYLVEAGVAIPPTLAVVKNEVSTEAARITQGVPFDLRLTVRNVGADTLGNVKIGISPDTSLALFGEVTQTVGHLAGGEEAVLSWTLQVDDGHAKDFSVVVAHMAADGGYTRDESVLFYTVETVPPDITPVFPRPDATVGSARPPITIRIDDDGSGVDLWSSTVWIDENIVLDGETRNLAELFDFSISQLLFTPDFDLNPGLHTLKVKTEDFNGNTAEEQWTFHVDTNAASQFVLEFVMPEPFSPNGDGIDDEVFFRCALQSATSLTATVFSEDGGLVRTLFSNQPVPAGIYQFPWDGRDDAASIVPDGVYRIEITARDGDRSSAEETEVRVNTEPLAITGVLPLAPPKMKLGDATQKTANKTARAMSSEASLPTAGTGMRILCTIPRDARVELQVYPGEDTTGTAESIASMSQMASAGLVEFIWLFQDDSGVPVPPGVYSFAFEANDGIHLSRLDNAGTVELVGEAASPTPVFTPTPVPSTPGDGDPDVRVAGWRMKALRGTEGEDFFVEVDIFNQGSGTTSWIEVSLYLSSDNDRLDFGSDYEVTPATRIAALEPNDNVVVRWDFKVPNLSDSPSYGALPICLLSSDYKLIASGETSRIFTNRPSFVFLNSEILPPESTDTPTPAPPSTPTPVPPSTPTPVPPPAGEIIELSGEVYDGKGGPLAGNTYFTRTGITIPKGQTLTIQPCIFKMGPGTGITVYGTLNVAGNSSSNAIFTSWDDDTVGGRIGESDADPRPGEWGSISYAAESS